MHRNMQVAAAVLASDPVHNISHLETLQSELAATQGSQHQLQSLTACMIVTLPNIVGPDKNGRPKLNTKILQELTSTALAEQHEAHAEQSRVGLAVLLLGVWAQRLQSSLQLQPGNTSEAAEEVPLSPSSHGKAVGSSLESTSSLAADEAADDTSSALQPQVLVQHPFPRKQITSLYSQVTHRPTWQLPRQLPLLRKTLPAGLITCPCWLQMQNRTGTTHWSF